MDETTLVTGAAGRVGSVGKIVVELLRKRNLSVRALVRREDERSDALRATGAEIVVGDLTRAPDVARALQGCRRMYFGMSVSAPYLEATVTTAAVARERRDLEVVVNISQMTVSQMSLTNMTDSPQQRQHWLGEQVLNWSGLPVVHVRATVFLQNFFFLAWAAESIAARFFGCRIRSLRAAVGRYGRSSRRGRSYLCQASREAGRSWRSQCRANPRRNSWRPST